LAILVQHLTYSKLCIATQTLNMYGIKDEGCCRQSTENYIPCAVPISWGYKAPLRALKSFRLTQFP